jgi:DNA-binding NtrC family response regulator
MKIQNQKTRKLEPWTRESFPCQTYQSSRILMVDDDPCLCELNAEVLRRHCYEVTTSKDGESGWEELQINPYHLLITENNLSGITGVGLVKKLRSADMPLPVIVITGTLPSWQSAEYSWLLKATKLLKPYTIEDLLDLVKKVLDETAGVRAEMVLPRRWQSQPPLNRLRLC